MKTTASWEAPREEGSAWRRLLAFCLPLQIASPPYPAVALLRRTGARGGEFPGVGRKRQAPSFREAPLGIPQGIVECPGQLDEGAALPQPGPGQVYAQVLTDSPRILAEEQDPVCKDQGFVHIMGDK